MSASKSASPSVDTLSTLERLILAQAVYEFGSSKWDKVATILSTHPLLHRPKNFYTPEVSLVSAIHGSRIPTEIGIVTYRHVIDYSLLSCTMQTLTCERWVGLAPIYHFLLTTYSTARAARTAEEVGVSRQHDVAWYVNICLAPAVLSLAQIHYVARVKEINELLNEEETKFKYVAILFSNILFVHTFGRRLVDEIDQIRSGKWDDKIRADLLGVPLRSSTPPVFNEPAEVRVRPISILCFSERK